MIPCVTHPDSPSNTLSGRTRLISWRQMDLTLMSRKKVSLVEQHCAPSIMGHVEPIREKLVVIILNRFLQGDNVPFPCTFVSQLAPSSAPWSWIPVVDAQPFLWRMSGWARCCRSKIPEQMCRAF